MIALLYNYTSAMLSIAGKREQTHLAHARFLNGCSGMVECLLLCTQAYRESGINCCDYLCHAEVKPLSHLSSLTLTAALVDGKVL